MRRRYIRTGIVDCCRLLAIAVLVAASLMSLRPAPPATALSLNFTQASYRWYQNLNSLSQTLTPLAAQNTTAAAPVPGTPFRLRQLINAAALATAGSATFNLQYAFNGTTSTCSTSFTGVTYSNVTSTSPISFYNNSTLTDGQNITALSGDPTDGLNTVVPENYLQSNTKFSNTQSQLLAGQDGEWDAALNDTSASPGYYCFRVINSSGTVLGGYTYVPALQVVDQPPTAPASLSQTAGSAINNGQWINQNSVVFGGTATDGDYTDTLKLCVELEPSATAFTNTNTSCGSGVSYSGTAVAMSDTIGSLSTNTQYHWQTRTLDSGGNYSAWVAFGTSPNFGVDTTPPTTGSVYDGTTNGIESLFNNGSLSQLSANWTGFSDTGGSGVVSYHYSIGTTAGGTDILASTSTTSLSVTATGLSLHTGQTYYFNVTATDLAGNVSAVVSSSGQRIAPTLSFSISPTSLSFASLGPNNPIPWTDTETTTLSASSNAYNGFVIRAYMPQLLSNGSTTIPNFSGGSYASPNTWISGNVGFGYTSSDTSIQGVNKFQSNPCPGGLALVVPGCYAPYSNTAPGDIVADQAGSVSGAAVTDSFTITDRATVSPTQTAAPYSGLIVYSLTASF